MMIQLADLRIQLLPELAAWLPDHQVLLVSDIHLGKSATFRTRGIPVPKGENATDLGRLTRLVSRTGAMQIMITGDLVHASDGLTPETIDPLRDWLREIGIPVTLIEGNHDRRAGLSRHHLPLTQVESLTLDGVTLIHDPEDHKHPGPTIHGHLHPSIRLPESPRRNLRLPCFHLYQDRCSLPGFGSFTGTHPIKIKPGDRVFVPLRDAVQEVPSKILQKRTR